MSTAPSIETGIRDAVVVSWHGPEVTEPLRAAILPVLTQLQRHHPDVYLERHWVGGPHLAVIAPPSGSGVTGPDLAAVRQRLETALAEVPGGPELAEGPWLSQAAALGRSELIEPPYGPLRPDRQVSLERYRLRSLDLVGREAYPLKERFLARAVPAVDASLRRGDRMGSALRLLALHGSRWPLGGLEVGQLTYRSHLEDYLHLQDAAGKPGAVRAALDAAAAPHAAAARDLVTHLLQEAPTGRYQGEDDLLGAWSRVLDDVWPAALEAADAGAIGFEPGAEYADRAARLGEEELRRWGYGEDRSYSEYHKTQRSLSTLPEPVAVREFSAYRFLTNQAYRTLPLLDISASQRYLLCALLVDAVEAVTGTTWQDLMAEAAATAESMLSERGGA